MQTITPDPIKSHAAFLVLAAIAALGGALFWLLMPETRPAKDLPAPGGAPA
jgi:predicted MFS family arabinose efflux permease